MRFRYALVTAFLCALAGCDQNTDWPLYGRTFGEERYSPLDQINTETVSRLGVAWTFDEFVVRGRTHRGVQATPLVIDGVIYFTGPWSVVYAHDAKTGKQLWVHDPDVDGQAARFACCDAVNRGVAYRNSKIYVGTLDGFLVALDAKTGREVWKADTITDSTRSYTITGAPRVAGDNIVIGNGGAELGVRGYASAFNAETGTLSWRFFTVPGAGPDENETITAARQTWSSTTRWELGGGGTVWDSMTYDPKLNLIYIGVGNGGPWPAWARNTDGTMPDNLYLSSIVAVDATSGKMRWHYQTTPGDSWDYTATQNMILTELVFNGRKRDVLMQAPKNGFFYVLDRATGELLSAEKYTAVSWAERVDLATGRPIISDSAVYKDGPKIVWPSTAGGHNWQPMAYSPDTGLVYIPTLEMPMRYQGTGPVQYLAGANNTGANTRPPVDDLEAVKRDTGEVFRDYGVLKAWDPVAAKVVWQSEPQSWWNGGLLATGGGLALQGGLDGSFTAYNAASGKVLKRLDFGVGIMGAPVTYEIDGTQYIAVVAGVGGAMNSRPYFPGNAALTHENNEQLIVFKLDGEKPTMAPPRIPLPQEPVYSEGLSTDEAFISHGRNLFVANCSRCHATGGALNGYPNLWNMPLTIHENFESIVRGGDFIYSGMPRFDDVLKRDDVRAIHSFLSADQARIRSGSQPKATPVTSGH